ncbi:hypothetical protein FH609_005310 [Streptomyces sp. 3MP-14]|uniref:Putative T7SS secretion signal domain-containing protein n=1 Tax=Streptomyces mimosae TaxID=2586635 RepID=A0A5N6ANC7_9ACTN|nr:MULTISPECIES: hypothetical protein [Streptomyces]KAB8169715.1 hypothetical protein FH607_002990 [Streptomyces mimosae]KAB8178463.1 hypothetical protein FH609_005310 [Streptomyces sp. 3MP-14]
MTFWPSTPVEPDAEQAGQYPALGFVPCPGRQSAIDHVAEQVRSTTTALGDIVALLRGAGQGQWRGQSAEAFRERFDDDFKPKVEQVHESFLLAAQALEEWAEFVPGQQRVARSLEGQAQEIQTSLDALPPAPGWDELLGREDDQRDGGDAENQEEAERAARERMRLLEQHQQLQEQLAEVRQQAEWLRDYFIEQGDAIADRIARAMAMAPNEPGFFSRLGSALVDAATDIVEAVGEIATAVGEWIVEHAAMIAAIGDVLSFVSTVVGLAALVAGPAAPVLIGVSAGLAAGALVAHGTARLAGHDVPLRSFGQDLLGAIPVIGAFGRTGAAIARTQGANTLNNVGTLDSVIGLVEDPSVFESFVPTNPRQWLQAFSGGHLLVGFENAWQSGAQEG